MRCGRRDPRGAWRGRDGGGGRRHDARRPRRGAGRLPVARHPDYQRGRPAPGLWSEWEREDFIKALDANMLTPIALMKAVLPA
jgi:hypothetical protein